MDRDKKHITFIRYNDVLRVKYSNNEIDWSTLKIVY